MHVHWFGCQTCNYYLSSDCKFDGFGHFVSSSTFRICVYFFDRVTPSPQNPYVDTVYGFARNRARDRSAPPRSARDLKFLFFMLEQKFDFRAVATDVVNRMVPFIFFYGPSCVQNRYVDTVYGFARQRASRSCNRSIAPATAASCDFLKSGRSDSKDKAGRSSSRADHYALFYFRLTQPQVREINP